MSLNLYFANIFGKIKPTHKIEAEHQALLKDYQLFNSFYSSSELKLFIELNELVNSDSFTQKKMEIQQLKFKGSDEYNLLNEFSGLKKDRKIQKFFVTEKSDELKRFYKVGSSKELDRYKELKAFVESPAFTVEKNKLKAETFKGSKEEGLKNEFNQLKKNKKLITYFRFIDAGEPAKSLSYEKTKEWKEFQQLIQKNQAKFTKEEKKQLKALRHLPELKKYRSFLKSRNYSNYQSINKSNLPGRFKEMEKIVNSKDFQDRKAYLCDKNKFEKTETFAKYQEFLKLKESDNLKFYFKYEKSSDYKNYLQIKDSNELKRYKELETLTQSKEFLDRKAYLEDIKRWDKTDDSKKEIKLGELQKLPGIINYLKYKDSTAFDFIKNWELVFEDDFNKNLNKEKWSNKSFQALKAVGENFSQQGDLQAITEGKNIHITDSILSIEVKKEKTNGLVWKPMFGFFEEEFEFSSGLITSVGSNWWNNGIIEIKAKYNSAKGILDTIYLLGEERSPQISLFELGSARQVGLRFMNEEGIQESLQKFSGLKRGEFYIFRLEWSNEKLRWTINNYEIFNVSENIPSIKMHLNISSIVVNKPSLPHSFDIDWIRVYKEKT